jgi:hypothetical protein
MIVIHHGQSKGSREAHLAALAVCLRDPSCARRLGLIAAGQFYAPTSISQALPPSPQS